MNVEYINPFIEGSRTVLMQILGKEASLGQIYLKKSPYKSDSVIVLVGITGVVRGQVALVMSKEVAEKTASIMMGGVEVSELNEMARSAISELANMIMGNTATILYNTGKSIEITPPSLLLGDNMEISSGKILTVCIPLKVNDEIFFNLDVSLEEKR